MEKLIEKFLNAHFCYDPKHFLKMQRKINGSEEDV